MSPHECPNCDFSGLYDDFEDGELDLELGPKATCPECGERFYFHA
jgi:predicted RNA-binding Zn-ribbon protein involved in translation (DUF1610 family)